MRMPLALLVAIVLASCAGRDPVQTTPPGQPEPTDASPPEYHYVQCERDPTHGAMQNCRLSAIGDEAILITGRFHMIELHNAHAARMMLDPPGVVVAVDRRDTDDTTGEVWEFQWNPRVIDRFTATLLIEGRLLRVAFVGLYLPYPATITNVR